MSRRSHPDYDFVPVYAGASHGYRYARPSLTSPRLKLTTEVVRCRPGDIFLGLDLAAHYLPHCVEQIAAWRSAGARIHNVVYDLLPLRQPGWFTPATQLHFSRWFEAVALHSDQLLCISDAVADDVRSEIGNKERPSVARLMLGGDIAGSAPSHGLSRTMSDLLRAMENRATILMVGTIEPRKGYDVALAAFERLWRDRPDDAPDLLIVGKPGWRTEKLQKLLSGHPENGLRLHWQAEVSDEALTELYERCSAMLVASLGEGFGLPLSEAAFHRKWVLARDLPVFREQHLPNCLYFGDDSPDALGDRIADLIAHAEQGRPPAAAVPAWSDCLDQLLETLGIATNPSIRTRKPATTQV